MAMNLQKNQKNELLFVGFNQDFGCFACGTDGGFKIFNCIAGNSNITMENGRSRPLSSIRPGDSILSLGKRHGEISVVPRTVEALLDRGIKQCVELELHNGDIIQCTEDHRILVTKSCPSPSSPPSPPPSLCWMEAKDIPTDSNTVSIITHHSSSRSSPSKSIPSSGSRLVSRRTLPTPLHVYDLSMVVDEEEERDDESHFFHSFIANNILCHNCDPFKETFQRDFNKGGIGYVEMLFRCNILALVGGGKNSRYPPHKVMIWDDHQNRCIGELSFRSEVRAVKLRRDRVVVVLEYKIYVYNFADLKLVDHIETIQNTKGLCALCPYSSNTVLVCPGLQKGHVRCELYDHKKTTLIEAHETALACFALNFDGTRLATASETGTLIRIFDTATGNPLQELRRGADRAEIYSIAFNPTTQFLACSSDKGTVHVFTVKSKGKDEKEGDANGAGAATEKGKDAVASPSTSASGASSSASPPPASSSASSKDEKNKDKDKKSANSTSSLSFMKSMLPKYFSSEWSFAQFRVPDARTIVAFGQEKNSVIIVSADGVFYKAIFDPDKSGSEMTQSAYAKFIKSADEE